MIRGNFPNIAYFVPAKSETRIPFKCRVISEGGQAFSQSINGLSDIGMSAVLSTPKEFKYETGCRVLWNDVFYSVASITPFIADVSMQGFTKKKLLTEYVIQLE